MTELTPPHRIEKLQIHAWWFTALLIGINVGLFAWQIISGVNITDPSSIDAIAWGADFTPLTFSGQPERLFSSMFFHFGMIHLMLNMWALYIFGGVAEQLFGRIYYIGMYFLAGLMAAFFQVISAFVMVMHFCKTSTLPTYRI